MTTLAVFGRNFWRDSIPLDVHRSERVLLKKGLSCPLKHMSTLDMKRETLHNHVMSKLFVQGFNGT